MKQAIVSLRRVLVSLRKVIFSLRTAIVSLALSGVLLLVRGAWMIYPPAAFLLGGSLLLLIAFGLVGYAPDKK